MAARAPGGSLCRWRGVAVCDWNLVVLGQPVHTDFDENKEVWRNYPTWRRGVYSWLVPVVAQCVARVVLTDL